MTKRLGLILACLTFTVGLLWTYADAEERVYGPSFRYRPIEWPFLILCLVFATLPSLWMPLQIKRPSQVAYWFLYLLVIVPCMFMPYEVLRVSPTSILPFQVCLLGAFAMLGVIYHFPVPSLTRIKVSEAGFKIAVITLSAVLIATTILTTGLKIDLSLTNVYIKRFVARESAPPGSMAAYIFSLLGNSLAPLMMAWGLVNKSLVLTITSLVSLVVVFSLTGLKSTFFTPILIYALYLLLRKGGRNFGLSFSLGACGLVLVAAIERCTTGTIVLTLLFVDRLCFTPGMLSSYYWEFFSSHPYVFLSDSILGSFINNPYDRHVGPLIGKVYFGRDQTNATTGIWAQGFAHFGYVGMFLATACAAVTLVLFDSIAKDRKLISTALVLGLVGVFWANVAFHSSIISEGLFLTFGLLYLAPFRDPEVAP